MWPSFLSASIYKKQKLRIIIDIEMVKLSLASKNLPYHPSDGNKRHR